MNSDPQATSAPAVTIHNTQRTPSVCVTLGATTDASRIGAAIVIPAPSLGVSPLPDGGTLLRVAVPDRPELAGVEAIAAGPGLVGVEPAAAVGDMSAALVEVRTGLDVGLGTLSAVPGENVGDEPAMSALP
jgi:hypothetical protein